MLKSLILSLPLVLSLGASAFADDVKVYQVKAVKNPFHTGSDYQKEQNCDLTVNVRQSSHGSRLRIALTFAGTCTDKAGKQSAYKDVPFFGDFSGLTTLTYEVDKKSLHVYDVSEGADPHQKTGTADLDDQGQISALEARRMVYRGGVEGTTQLSLSPTTFKLNYVDRGDKDCGAYLTTYAD